MATSGCPDAHELLRLLDDEGDAETEAHVSRCADCRLTLDAFVRTGSLTDTASHAETGAVAWVEEIQRRLRSSLAPGAKLGRYQIRRCAGMGGMGMVYEAYDPELDRRVALKVLRPHRRDEGQRRLLREARALAKLSHGNVVSVFDVGTDDGRVFIAMELIDGQSLREWLDERPSHPQILEVFAEAGRGLAAAHDRGLVHRDFKPDNVLVGEDGRVLVTDFGLARHRSLSETDDVTREGTVVGTPAYMAPEVRSGEEADARSDQFSFAVALYQALHGHPPRIDLPLMAGARTPQLGWRMRRLLRRALSGDPRSRFPSMGALLVELERCRTSHRGRNALAVVAVAAGVLALSLTTRSDEPSARLSTSLSTSLPTSLSSLAPPSTAPAKVAPATTEDLAETGRPAQETATPEPPATVGLTPPANVAKPPASRASPPPPTDPLDTF